MRTHLIHNSSDELIIFLTGWGCDNNPFLDIPSTKDVLICWDYNDLNFSFDFSKYKKFYLLAYSAGAFIVSFLKSKLPYEFSMTIALNGNPMLFDNYFGIDKNTLCAMKNINIDNAMDFLKRYVLRKTDSLDGYKYSRRTFESSKSELKKLENLYNEKFIPFEFDIALISDKDKVFHPERQVEYYKNKYKIVKNSAHNIFLNFNTFDELIDYASNPKGL